MDIRKRKLEHLEIVQDDTCDMSVKSSVFNGIGLNYRSLPEVDFKDVNASCEFLGMDLSFPFYISPMTGGVEDAKSVNEILAVAANQVGVGIGLGSLRAMIEDESLVDTFDIKALAKDVPLIGNIGLVQLNYGVGIDNIKFLVDRLKLDALSVHLNPLQEVLQPEGDTDFSGLLSKLANLVRAFDIPIIVKDVGTGVSTEVSKDLISAGVEYIDVSGTGGTSWAYIEGQRGNKDVAAPFVAEGFKTSDLLEAQVQEFSEVNFIAGGGLRSGADLFKCIALGAVVGNSARPFAMAAKNSLEDVIDLLETWKKQFEISMFVTGVSSYDEVKGNRSLITKNGY